MPSPSPIERVKPLLGTFVHIRVDGLPPAPAHKAIDQAFAEITTIHDLMSFHQPDSEVSQINRRAAYEAVPVDERTWSVLQAALDFAARSNGAFDPCVGGALVKRGLLPAPTHAGDPTGDWRSIELLPGNRVRFHCPTWIDLGGIAKGYAVDRAVEILVRHEPEQICVNAGGDLRVWGPKPERTGLDLKADKEMVPVVQLRQESMASSYGAMLGRERHDVSAAHVATGQRRNETSLTFVSVMAPFCMHADALTKIVMALGERAKPQLQAFQAHALLRADCGWQEIAGQA
jgi:thiamine biosynthesis lipoprotein